MVGVPHKVNLWEPVYPEKFMFVIWCDNSNLGWYDHETIDRCAEISLATVFEPVYELGMDAFTFL